MLHPGKVVRGFRATPQRLQPLANQHRTVSRAVPQGRGRQGLYGGSGPRRADERGGRGQVGQRQSKPQREDEQDWPAPSVGPMDTFEGRLAVLQAGHAQMQAIEREAWEALLRLVERREHAGQALALLRADAKVRDAGAWNWSQSGYGQLALLLVQVSSSVGDHSIAAALVQEAQSLHLNAGSKDFIAGLMRKMVGAGAPGKAVAALYQLERETRGRNTAFAAAELSRVWRWEEQVEGVQELVQQAQAGDVDLKPQLMDDLCRWLSQRGVRM